LCSQEYRIAATKSQQLNTKGTKHTTVNVLATQQPLAASSPITTDESPTLATYSVSSRIIAMLAVVPAVLTLPPLVLGHVSVPQRQDTFSAHSQKNTKSDYFISTYIKPTAHNH